MKRQGLFDVKLTGKESWLVARDSAAYALVEYIKQKEHLPGTGERLCPSTNLVYGFGDLLLKIYAPAVCGYQAKEDYERELFALQQLRHTDLRVPHIISSDCIHDRYDFYYLITERLHILPSASFVNTCTIRELKRFGEVLFENLATFKNIVTNVELAKRKSSDSPLITDRQNRLISLIPQYKSQFVHGDLSGDNILYDGRRLALIDFEDWTYTSPLAEYPTLVFELLHGEQAYIEAFFSKSLTPEFVNEIFDGVLYHYNWEQYVDRYCSLKSSRPSSLNSACQFFFRRLGR